MPGLGEPMTHFYDFLSGAAMFGALTIGLFFIKFWRSTQDRLFFYFGIAFGLMGVERLVLEFMHDPGNERHNYIYLIRLFAFLLIAFAIVDKNRNEDRF
jgi:hypothetical protein